MSPNPDDPDALGVGVGRHAGFRDTLRAATIPEMTREDPPRERSLQSSGTASTSMRLFTRLLISHTVPVLAVTCALVAVLFAVARISFVLSTLSGTELVVLRAEGEVHRAAWEVDVQMRRGQTACTAGTPSSEVRPGIARSTQALVELLGRTRDVSRAIRDTARGYVAVASEILAGDACERIVADPIQARRRQLDERMTNAWVERLVELHTAVGRKDEQARRTAELAMWAGIPLATISFVLAMILAAQMARVFKRPLANLAQLARRVGRGDFRSPVQAEGPVEIVELADELERMRAQLEQLEKLKQGFLASVSHELRTPLSKIREALALLSDGAVGELDARKARVVQIARTACEREILMVTTLLDLSRLRAGSPLRLAKGASIEHVVEHAVADERGDATARGVTITTHLDSGGSHCSLDTVLMERAIANLVRNAVSVSKRGQSVVVTCDRMPVSAAGGAEHVRIAVRDEGPGVPPSIRATVFDAFVTHDVPTSGRAIGVGIGLALAREVARAHGGDLVLLDTEEGACFEMTLPVDDAQMPRRSERPRSLGLAAVPSFEPNP